MSPRMFWQIAALISLAALLLFLVYYSRDRLAEARALAIGNEAVRAYSSSGAPVKNYTDDELMGFNAAAEADNMEAGATPH